MKIPISELKEGTILSQEVTGPNGQLLLKKGMPLTDKHIKAFKMWGITEFETEEESDAPLLNFEPRILAEADTTLQKHFYGSDLSNPVLSKIYSFCLNRFAQKLTQKGSLP